VSNDNRRDMRFLKGYAFGATSLIIVLSILAFRHPDVEHFKEIDVGRINVREPDGTLRMTISNAAQSMGWVIDGKAYPGRPKNAGMLFFNEEGEENGGLSFDGRKTADGKVNAGALLAFDQYDSDQIVTLSYDEGNGRRRQGLTVMDRADNITLGELMEKVQAIRAMPDGPAKDSAQKALLVIDGQPLAAPRLFAGRDRDRTAIVRLSDPEGRTRLRMSVDSTGVPSIEFLDEDGKVTRRISGNEGGATR
jgi:hypothetical protein